MKSVKLTERFFEGAVSFQFVGGAIKPWRLPFEKLKLFDEGLVQVAEMPSGVRLRLSTDAVALTLSVVPDPQPRPFDLTIAGKLYATVTAPADGGHADFRDLPAGPKLVEIWLPQAYPTAVKGLKVNASARVSVPRDRRPKWITYGSSITHCCGAHSPARIWPAVMARKHDLNLTCLGYGGQCHLDSMIGRMIRDMQADFISLKLGINTHGGTSSKRTFKFAAIGMVQIIREKHPNTPIALIGPIISPPRETQRATAVSPTLQEMRQELSDAVERLKACGDRNVHYFDGLDLFGPNLVEKYLPDQLHPNGDGYELLAENFSRVVMGRLQQ